MENNGENKKKPSFYNYDGYDYGDFWDKRAYEDNADLMAIEALSVPDQDASMLEIGAGTGRNTLRYPDYKKIYLVDYSITMLEKAVERLGDSDRFEFILADTYLLPFKEGSFERVSMIRVSHHLSDLGEAYREIGRVSKNGARFLMDYANKTNIKAYLRYFLKKQSWNPSDREPAAVGELTFDYHPEMVEEVLKNAGFRILRKRPVGILRGLGIARNKKTMGLANKVEGFFQKTFTGSRLTPSIFMDCEKEMREGFADNKPEFVCPACKGELTFREGEGHVCRTCAKLYPYKNRIHNFRSDLSSPEFTEFERNNPAYRDYVNNTEEKGKDNE
ncbi:MAG: class I SAM-dependent methyltransferase [Eubacteriales bacterium]|nr:class I SAM-dependent methyltransferase [Eubacteriales bacterium]